MPRETHPKKEIAALSSAHARFTLAAQTDSLSLMDTARDLNLVLFYFVGARPAQRHGARRTMQRFFQCDHDVGFDISATFSCSLSPAASPESRPAAAAAKERLKEIAKAGAIELKLSPAIAAPLVESAAGLLAPALLPAGRRLESARSIPIRTKLIVC